MKIFRLTLVALAASATLLPVSGSAQNEPTYTISEIADGVYRATSNFHGTVFMVTSEGIILADPLNVGFAEWFKADAEARFGVPVRYVIYSHHHWDHATGGGIFADTAQFVGHANMLDHLALPPASTQLSDIEGQYAPRAALDTDGNGTISRIEAEVMNDTLFRAFDADLDGSINGAELMRGPISLVHPPTITYNDQIDIELGGKRVRMEWLGEFNHSLDSSMISFPDASVLFLVDFVTFGRLPYQEMDYELGRYEEWMAAIRDAEEISKNFDHVATGHGPMGTSANVTEWREYFEALEAAVQAAIDDGQSLEEMMETIELPEYNHWAGYDWLDLNVLGMYHFLTD
jgi:glyoxylase-like metal-dependent hydrolase (beta-lactamase superfamily II)